MADEQFEETLAREIAGIIREQIAPLRNRIDQLEREVVELRSKGITYSGVWQRAASYQHGQVVTFDGSMWAAVEAVGPNMQPGKSNAWQLCCRSGRDLRNGKGDHAT
jgi:hypothetical protein